jgi:hypothetical protein
MSYFALIVLDRFENYLETDDQGAGVRTTWMA